MNKEDLEILKENFTSKEDFEGFKKEFLTKGGTEQQAEIARSFIEHLKGDCNDSNCQFHSEKENLLQEGFYVGWLTRDTLD